MDLKYSDKSLVECLNKVSKEINITKGKIKYKKIKEKHSIIGNKVTIEIQLDSNDSLKNKQYIKRENVYDKLNKEVDYNNDKQIGAGVENGKIIIIENLDKDDLGNITIKPCEKIRLFINGKPCNQKIQYKVTRNDEITYKSDKMESAKIVIFSVSENKMEGYLHIEYIPQYTYSLKINQYIEI